MQRRSALAIRCFCLPGLALCLALVAMAKDGRDFSGFYALSNVTGATDNADRPDRTATVEVTLTVQLFNYSDVGDIKEPVVALLESGSHAKLGEFNAVKLMPAKRDVIVSGKFTVSRMEFDSWSMRGGSPQVVVIYKDEAGRTLRQHAQLTRRPMLPPPTAN